MSQEKVWDSEYRNSKFLTKENKPQADVLRFVRWLRKQPTWRPGRQVGKSTQNKDDFADFAGTKVLDLGSGTGRNSLYFAENGANVTGLEISKTALDLAKSNFQVSKGIFDIKYIKQSIGEKYPCKDEEFDVTIDVMSSNSLSENEREVYLSETYRVLKNGGLFFVKALCSEGDLNAKYLLKNFPGSEAGTYIMPETGIVERVWSKEEFIKTYKEYFKILFMEKKTNYVRMNNRSYKRNYWIVYMKK
jgi:ubiquinone/menaquinone biosynthesis C-methylase UbiE